MNGEADSSSSMDAIIGCFHKFSSPQHNVVHDGVLLASISPVIVRLQSPDDESVFEHFLPARTTHRVRRTLDSNSM